jgi:hypothetical protein
MQVSVSWAAQSLHLSTCHVGPHAAIRADVGVCDALNIHGHPLERGRCIMRPQSDHNHISDVLRHMTDGVEIRLIESVPARTRPAIYGVAIDIIRFAVRTDDAR